jgi:hypothetical protein
LKKPRRRERRKRNKQGRRNCRGKEEKLSWKNRREDRKSRS